jgi:isoleucyl-tRNA synthetase
LVGFIEELTNWYVRLNRDRLKGQLGEDEALTGLCVLYEVLWNMTVIMAPFTPFFAEYLYQHLRKLHPFYRNTNPEIPVDAFGKADSVHYLMLPNTDDNRLNPVAEARFKVLQQAVSLSRTAREKHHIRATLPLKNVLVVSANVENLKALEYLKSYFLNEVNAWELTTSHEWSKLCTLTIKPNFGELGAKLGNKMKVVSKAVSQLSQTEIGGFLETGAITVAGIEFTKTDLQVKIEFSGDKKRYEACGSDDGKLLVAIDTLCDDEVLQELQSRLLAGSVQKLRKSGGLVVGDKVEIFYDEDRGSSTTSASASTTDLPSSLMKYAGVTYKRLKSFPLPITLKPKYARVLANDIIKDNEISKYSTTLQLTQPCVSIDSKSVYQMVTSLLSLNDEPTMSQMVDILVMYIQSMDYETVLSKETIMVMMEKKRFTFVRGVHYFGSTLEMLMTHRQAYLSEFPYLPSFEDLTNANDK